MKDEFELDGPCEEASPLSRNFKIDCGRPATALVWHNKDQRAYRMCPMCADHNVTNRGGILLVPSKPVIFAGNLPSQNCEDCGQQPGGRHAPGCKDEPQSAKFR